MPVAFRRNKKSVRIFPLKITVTMKQPRKISIHRTFLIYLILVGVASVFSVGYLWILSEKAQFEEEASALHASYMERQEETLQREVHRALAFIGYMQSQTEKRLKDTVKSRVYEAHSIATHIYEQNHPDKPVEKIQDIIRDALRTVRFNKNRGYYFAFDLNGIETMFPVRPEMEGRNMLNVRGGKGEFVVADMLEVVGTKGEGFYRYTWTKPGREGYFPKVAFVKRVDAVGWVIGTGEYLDDVEKDIQEECLKWISNIKFGKDGYVFAGQWDGLSLSGPAAGKNMYDVEDINGVKIVQELIKAAKSGGGFVHYVLPKFEGKKHAPKISYAKGVDKWQWYIGSGVYVDEIEAAIARKQQDLSRKIRTNIRNALFILFALLIGIGLIVKLLSDRIRNNLRLFAAFFGRASSDSAKIEQDSLHFSEFVELAGSANEMIDKRRRAEAALHASHERFLTVLDSIDATIYVSDMETYEILFMNRHMIESFGRDMTGEICWDVFRGKSEPCPDCTNDRLIDPTGEPSGVCVWQGKNPITGKWYINYDRAIEWTTGRLVRLQIATDITHLKQMEEALRQAHKMEAVGNLAGGVAHEFNNVLGIIIGNVELAMDEVDKWHPARESLNEIRAAGLRARDVVRQLLNFSRKIDIIREPIEIDVIVKDALKLLRASIPADIEIREAIAPAIDPVLADGTQIHQLLINLGSNAAQAMGDEGGVLTIALDNTVLDEENAAELPDLDPGAHVRLSVSDTGHGIGPDMLDKIFDPYFTTKDVGKGTGMGLAVVHGIVKNHEGAVRVESRVDRGTTFHVYFPSSSGTVSRGIPEADRLPTGKESILFIDDEAALAGLYHLMLEKLGYAVTSETDPMQALAQFESNPRAYDLVISDMTMPKLTGDRLAREMLRIRPDLPIVVCTGFSEKISQENIREMGIKALLTKPVSKTELSKLVRKLLDAAKKGA